MNEVIKAKAEIYDIIRQQEGLQIKIADLQRLKIKKNRELQELEKRAPKE